MKGALERKEQIILFQNRRGYAPRWTCEVCGWVPMCTRCDVSLTYHKYTHKLNCHYCGYTISPPNKCDACGSSEIKMLGFGTEKIEEEISIHLSSDVKIQRMDLDTTRSKFAYQNIINDFENREIDILVGTQMVTKGLDFDNVSLVGVLNADDMLYYPDFRAFERAYQLMTQVSGRAGRKKSRGKVIVQTHTPDHWIIQKVMQNDYDGMYDQELYERKNYQYPPFYRLIRLTVRHKEKETTDSASAELAKMLQVKLGNRILGPEYPSVPRIKNVYNKIVTIKFERNASVAKVKAYLLDNLANLKQIDGYKSVRVKIDVDPL
jgi:primosomal protein N' (replication factor Y)